MPSKRLTYGLCLLAFLTMLSYAVANSAAQSLYLSSFGSGQLPRVWLGVALASIAATSFINRLSERIDIVRLFALGCRISGVSLLIVLGLAVVHPKAGAFLLYIWKDIYIIVLVELFWTFANVVFGMHAASRTYGLFCAAGSAGSVAGNLLLRSGAQFFGTQKSLWPLLPLLWVIGLGVRRLARSVPVPEPQARRAKGLAHGISVLRQSPVLPAVMLLVASAQASLTLVEFHFLSAIEQTSVGELERTAVLSNVYALINAVSFALQVGTSQILKGLGGPLTLAVVPGCAAAWLGWASFSPQALLPACAMQLSGKSLDYSLFRAAKELLYIPLSYAEKTIGKAIIDILVYRFAKGAVSFALLALSSLGFGPRSALMLLWPAIALWGSSVGFLLLRLRKHAPSRAGFFRPPGP